MELWEVSSLMLDIHTVLCPYTECFVYSSILMSAACACSSGTLGPTLMVAFGHTAVCG